MSRCPDSEDGKHEYTPDEEYDSTGLTWNCCHCGELKPLPRKRRRAYLILRGKLGTMPATVYYRTRARKPPAAGARIDVFLHDPRRTPFAHQQPQTVIVDSYDEVIDKWFLRPA